MSTFTMRSAIPSLAHQFHVACPFHSLHGKHGSSLETDFCWYTLCAHSLRDLPSVEGLQENFYVENPLIPPSAD